MCGIVGSFDFDDIERLSSLISRRGTKRASLCAVNPITGDLTRSVNIDLDSKLTELSSLKEHIRADKSFLTSVVDCFPYFILHVQSPTGRFSNYHPANPGIEEDHKKVWLWHNGMLNSDEYRKAEVAIWDTQIFQQSIYHKGLVAAAESFEGSFACIASGDISPGFKLFIFRNAISPMYYLGSTVCSVPFRSKNGIDKSNKLCHGMIYSIQSYGLEEVTPFNNTYNPFGV